MAETSDQPMYTRADSLIAQHRTGGAKGRVRASANTSARPGATGASRRSGSLLQRLSLQLIDSGGTSAGKLLSNVQIDAIRARLMRGGFPYGLKATQFAFVKWLAMVGASFIFVLCGPLVYEIFFGRAPAWVYPLSMMLGALYGFKAPDTWLNIRIRQRQLEIQLALADMIDLITVAVEAGLGLGAAIMRVTERFPNPLSEELMRTMQEVHLGRSQADALRDMGRRIDVADLTTFLTSLVQAEVLGLPIANVLRVQSERLRDKRSQRAREQAQKAPIKMIFPLVFFIFPALFIVILGPAAITIMKHPF